MIFFLKKNLKPAKGLGGWQVGGELDLAPLDNLKWGPPKLAGGWATSDKSRWCQF